MIFLAQSPDQLQIETGYGQAWRIASHSDDGASWINGKGMPVTHWGGIVRHNDADHRFECAAARLRDPDISVRTIRRKAARIWDQDNLSACAGERPAGFRILAIHANHEASLYQPCGSLNFRHVESLARAASSIGLSPSKSHV